MSYPRRPESFTGRIGFFLKALSSDRWRTRAPPAHCSGRFPSCHLPAYELVFAPSFRWLSAERGFLFPLAPAGQALSPLRAVGRICFPILAFARTWYSKRPSVAVSSQPWIASSSSFAQSLHVAFDPPLPSPQSSPGPLFQGCAIPHPELVSRPCPQPYPLFLCISANRSFRIRLCLASVSSVDLSRSVPSSPLQQRFCARALFCLCPA